jgi:hypothetical protein
MIKTAMAGIRYDSKLKKLWFTVSENELPEAKAWLLRKDGTIAERLKLSEQLWYDCKQLQEGLWFAKLEAPGCVLVKMIQL